MQIDQCYFATNTQYDKKVKTNHIIPTIFTYAMYNIDLCAETSQTSQIFL